MTGMSIGKYTLSHPRVQNVVASIILGLCPGIYQVITIMGAGGGQATSNTMANISNSVLYAIFFTTGMLSGSVLTTLGPRLTVFIGTTGYPLFLGGLWYYSTAPSPSLLFPLLTGAYIGFSGSLLWTATGFIAYTYSTPSTRGSYLSSQTGIQGAISTLACIIMLGVCFTGSAAPERRDSVSGKETQTVPRSVYVVFMVATVAACGLGAGGIVGVERVLGRMRGGGVEMGGEVEVEGMKNGKANKINFWTEVKDQRKLFTDWRVMILTIPFLAGEMGGFVIFSSLNALYFNIRTRSLTTFCSVLMQAIGSLLYPLLLDNIHLFPNLRTRSLVSLLALALTTIPMWSLLVAYLSLHPPPSPVWDYLSAPREFGWFLALIMLSGVNLTAYVTLPQFLLTHFNLTRSATARSAGYARGCIAAGQAIMFGVEAAGVRQLFIIILGFAFQGVGLLCMGLVCWVCMGVVVKDESVEGDGSRSEPEEFGGDCLDEGSEKARDRNDVMLI